MESVVSCLSPSDVVREPFPHVVVRDAIDPAFCDRLIDEFPPLEVVTQGRPCGSNQRFSYSGSEAMRDPRLSPLWREFVRTHQSQAFLDQMLWLFADHVRALYPWFEDEFGALDELRAGVRFRDGYEEADVLIEAQPSLNTPVTGPPRSVRAGHLDNPNKLFVGLFYLRHPDDRSRGGDLELYRYTTSRPVFDGHEIAHRYIEPVKTVGYERNVAVFFLNTPESLHGVTPRSPTPTTRLFLNLNVEVGRDLFDIPGRQTQHRRAPQLVRAAARRSLQTTRKRTLAAALLTLSCLFLVLVLLPEELGDRPYDVFGLKF